MYVNKMIISSVVLLGLLGFSVEAQAAASGKNIVTHGNGKGAVACSTCHGANGNGKPQQGYPYLAGQGAQYLARQLNNYASGQRQSPIMQPFAKALSDEEIQAVAKYYASLPLPHTSAGKNEQASNTGRRLATQGKWGDGVPACFRCHGASGQGIEPEFPAISGQSQAYLSKQLHAWQKGKRRNDPIGLMQAVANKLDDKEIKAVSGYLSNHSPATAQ